MLITRKGEEFVFRVVDGTKLSRRDYEFREPTLRREQTVWRVVLRGEPQGEAGESQPTEPTDDAEARAAFWSIQVDFIRRHHNELRVQLFVPKEETFPIPLKNTDATRSTHTDLDVMQEKRIDGYWNVDSNRSLSDSWKGFAKITLLKEELPRRYMWFKRRLIEDQKTTRPYQVWPEVWSKIGNAVQNLEKNKNGRPRSQNWTTLDE